MHPLIPCPSHRIPTLWSLYRPLLFATSSLPLPLNQRQILHSYIRDNFKRNRKLGNIEKIKRKWIRAEQASSFPSLSFASQADHSLSLLQLLYQLESSHDSSLHLSRTKELASHLISLRSLPSHPPLPPNSKPPSTPQAPKPRSSILHSTQFAPPMLRVKPQPVQTSMMIFNRRRKSQKRYDSLERAREYVEMMQEEEGFEGSLGKRDGGWGEEWKEWMREARGKEKREQERNNVSTDR